MLIGISPDYLYLHESQPKNISELHRPYFLAFCPKERNIETARNEIINKWKEKKSTEEIFSKIEDIGEIPYTLYSFTKIKWQLNPNPCH